MRTYWNPWVVRFGSNTSSATPADVTWSTMPARSSPSMNGMSAGFRCSVVTSPSGPSASPWVSVSRVPSGPRSPSQTQPLMFWPRSKTCTPGRTVVTATGRSSSTARTGGASERTRASWPWSTTSTASQPSASKPGSSQPSTTSRRSSSCPSIRSTARTCDRVLLQPRSEPTTVVLPSGCSTCSWASRAVRSPHWSEARSMPTWPRYHPSASTAPSTFAPSVTSPVTS